MSVITDMVVAEIDDAQEIFEDITLPGFTSMEIPGLTLAMLVALLYVLQGRPFRITKKLEKDFPVLIEEGPCVTKVSDELVNLLSQLNSAKSVRTKIASQWISNLKQAENKELIGPWDTFDGFPIEIVETMLLNLCKLSRTAVSKKKHLLLRQC